MCGILLIGRGFSQGSQQIAARQAPSKQRLSCEDFASQLQARGPDLVGRHTVNVGDGRCLELAASLLQLRGYAPGQAPLIDEAGNTLLYNGEVFSGLSIAPGQNDGVALLAALANAHTSVAVVQQLTKLRGPWSLIFWQASTQTVWWARDVIGRRSLLVHWPDANCEDFVLSSTAPGDAVHDQASKTSHAACSHQAGPSEKDQSPPLQQQQEQQQGKKPGEPLEVARSLTALNVGSENNPCSPAGQQMPWSAASGSQEERSALNEEGSAVAAGSGAVASGSGSQGDAEHWKEVPPGIYSIQMCRSAQPQPLQSAVQLHSWSDAGHQLLSSYTRALHLVSPAAADSTGACRCLQAGAGDGSTPDGIACSSGPCHAGKDAHDDQVPDIEMAAKQVLKALERAVAVRCHCIDSVDPPQEGVSPAIQARWHHGGQQATTPGGTARSATDSSANACNSQPSSNSPPSPPSCSCGPSCQPAAPLPDALPHPAPLLILFSGGVDSTLIAALAHKALPPHHPIDLATICFNGGQSADRLAALDAVQELAAMAPGRTWRLICVDASLADLDRHREHLLSLLAPARTIMDLNIGAALWLAARGKGRMRLVHGCAQAVPEGPGQWFRSAARVVLLGHGADEQCAGYGRHRTHFRLHGWQGLQNELAVDMRRLWQRNLGRDDRLVADHGREARHPFLDEDFMALLLSLPLPLIANLELPAGTGDKQLLRAALRMLGLPRAAARVKRAIQFGTGLGKLSNQRDFGSNRAANLHNAGSVRLRDIPGRLPG